MTTEKPIVRLDVADAYDRWAASYDNYDNPMLHSLALVQQEFPYSLQGKRVFEFGCGTGRNLLWAQDCGARLVAGCDLSAGMLGQAQQSLADALLIQRDMLQAMPEIADQSVDHVFFCLTLEHLADLETPLREARRMLAPGGVMTIAEIHPFLV